MFKLPGGGNSQPKHSDLSNFYADDKSFENLLTITDKPDINQRPDKRSIEDKRDDLYKFKKSVSLTRNYELYLETEKAYYKFTKEKLNW